MANPRYIGRNGEPTIELLNKLNRGKQVFLANLEWFCEKQALNRMELEDIKGVYLVGSHAGEKGWHDDTSDIDFVLLNPKATPENLHRYKREVLDRLLHEGEKRRWGRFIFC